MSSYVVIYFPSDDLSASAVGPFRSHMRAQRVCDRLDEAFEDNGIVSMQAEAAPQVVRLITESEALTERGIQ